MIDSIARYVRDMLRDHGSVVLPVDYKETYGTDDERIKYVGDNDAKTDTKSGKSTASDRQAES